MRNHKCVVIGGGKVAQRKVSSLLAAGAKVLVVSKTLTPQLLKYLERGSISFSKSVYRKSFLRGAFLVITATDDGKVNSRVYADAREKGMLVNCVDAPEQSNFIIPAVCSKGDFILTVSTSGKAPGLAGRMKEELSLFLTDDHCARLETISRVREKIKNKYSPEKKKALIKRLSRLSWKELKNSPEVRKLLI